eukprot:GHVS01108489.1.p1 GENE.GHVS01108489.1~~GHVS01108489.1.p1  ORF type:complete len:125 (-),score=16.99 GHVS01108489.1:86-460(-)
MLSGPNHICRYGGGATSSLHGAGGTYQKMSAISPSAAICSSEQMVPSGSLRPMDLSVGISTKMPPPLSRKQQELHPKVSYIDACVQICVCVGEEWRGSSSFSADVSQNRFLGPQADVVIEGLAC